MKRTEIELEYKVWLIEECLAKRMRGREAARRAGVGATTMQHWISRYRAEGIEAFQHNRPPRVYDEVTKRQAVEDYLNGEGSLDAIAEKYKICSSAKISDWVRVYNCHNEEKRKTEETVMADKTKNTLEFRVQIVKEHLDSGKSISTIADGYGLYSTIIRNWVKKYQEKGIAGLEDRRGQRLASQEPRTHEEELRIKNAQLEHEIYLLKLENELLKKVKELERGNR